jgi:hypothetical protein
MTMTRSICTIIAAPFALLLLSSVAEAQNPRAVQSTVRGFAIGSHGAMTTVEDDASPSGNMLSLALGYGVSQHLSFHAATSGARVAATDARERYFQSFIDIESRYTFGPASGRWRPHLALGASGRTEHHDRPEAAEDDPKLRTTIGATTGGGLSYYLVPAVALDGAVRYTFSDGNRTRVLVGLTWYPRAR